ncbi:hypothetical protein AB162_077 [Candidatus Palibaumannia cicadellinicola]|uniref:Uncharacterized protein n=1 Tax=Candidatus Palibaumannia cicadellinicola TaxID=186490 RepID=A0A0K2BK37_9GAMM|nr:hypothetical protein AB162_077 [Candidatus Baumannia cicadellinicola]
MDIKAYKNIISQAISKELFFNTGNFICKSCELKVKLAPN